MTFEWPPDSPRIPAEPWTEEPVSELALRYDDVENHGWYRNLDPTVRQLASHLTSDQLVVDYSGGTGILESRLFRAAPGLRAGILIVDASPKFLRLALEKFRAEPRVGFRLIHRNAEARHLQVLDQVLAPSILARGVDILVSTNAIHLYHDLPDLLRSWARALRPGGLAFVQSGNIRNPDAGPGEWIIDETVAAVGREAVACVRAQDRFARYRPVLDDRARMERHEALRNKYFLPVRPLDDYLQALTAAGFQIAETRSERIEASVAEWYDFLRVYHEGVLGWVGGVSKIEGQDATEADVRDRLEIMRLALARVFAGCPSFVCRWTYITAKMRVGP